MNLGSDPADQIVRYTLEGTEVALKLSGLAAKNFALFVYAVLKDQKKTRGKTRLVRMLKEQRPFKFFKRPCGSSPKKPGPMGCCTSPSATSASRGRSSWWSLPMTPPRSNGCWTT